MKAYYYYIITCLLSIMFVGLKLTGFINWSWWWVTVGFWGIPALIIIFLMVCCEIIGFIYLLQEQKKDNEKKKMQATINYFKNKK